MARNCERTAYTLGKCMPDLRVTALQTEQILGGTRSTRADAEVLADQSVISHYRRLTGKDTASTSSSAGGPASKQRPIEGECAICYDSLKASSFLTCCFSRLTYTMQSNIQVIRAAFTAKSCHWLHFSCHAKSVRTQPNIQIAEYLMPMAILHLLDSQNTMALSC